MLRRPPAPLVEWIIWVNQLPANRYNYPLLHELLQRLVSSDVAVGVLVREVYGTQSQSTSGRALADWLEAHGYEEDAALASTALAVIALKGSDIG